MYVVRKTRICNCDTTTCPPEAFENTSVSIYDWQLPLDEIDGASDGGHTVLASISSAISI